VEEIGDSCFDGCNNLHITIDTNNPIFKTDGKRIYKKDTGKEIE